MTLGARFGCVLADAGYGVSASFRQGLSARGLAWAVGIPRILEIYPADVAMLPPPTGSRRRLHEPDWLSCSAGEVLADAPWRSATWRRGTKGRLTAWFAALRIRVADGQAQQIGGRPAQHRHLTEAGRGKKAGRTTTAAQLARRAGHPRRPPAPRPSTAAMPALPRVDQRAA